MSYNGDFHSGKIEIKTELLRAIALRCAIKPRHFLADESKFRRTLEANFFRYWLARRVIRELGIAC